MMHISHLAKRVSFRFMKKNKFLTFSDENVSVRLLVKLNTTMLCGFYYVAIWLHTGPESKEPNSRLDIKVKD